MSYNKNITELLECQLARSIENKTTYDKMIRDIKKRRRWKRLKYVIFAVLFLVLAFVGTLTVEFEAGDIVVVVAVISGVLLTYIIIGRIKFFD